MAYLRLWTTTFRVRRVDRKISRPKCICRSPFSAPAGCQWLRIYTELFLPFVFNLPSLRYCVRGNRCREAPPPRGARSRDAGECNPLAGEWPEPRPSTPARIERHQATLARTRTNLITGPGVRWRLVFSKVFRGRNLVEIRRTAMSNLGGSNVLANLKQRMQTLRDELDHCKDNYDDKCRELEAEREQRNEVSVSGLNAAGIFGQVSFAYTKGTCPQA